MMGKDDDDADDEGTVVVSLFWSRWFVPTVVEDVVASSLSSWLWNHSPRRCLEFLFLLLLLLMALTIR